jgi:NAD+ kinase
MIRKINKIKIHSNENEKSEEVKNKLITLLLDHNFNIVDSEEDLLIAIGGDGSCLRAIKHNNFSNDSLYVGINAGTLGFLQEVKIEEVEDFVNSLNNCDYKVEEIGIQETEIISSDGTYLFYSLNEIVIREKDLNTVILDIEIDNARLEKYIGDGILISTSIGSTAYNLSFGGSIVYNSLHTLQITPIAPLNNKSYRNLLNSVIVPENTEISIKPLKKSLLISIDGDNKVFDEVISIKTYVKNKRIKFLRLQNYNFYEKINDKFLSK